jgi:integral membrane protein (TIGR01906 family)
MTIAAAAPPLPRGRWSPASVAVGAATILTLAGIAVGLFFNPVWVAFEQGRTHADLWTGYPPQTVHAVTDAVLGEVYLGPGTFSQSVDGVPVFSARERAHMGDVRGIVVAFFWLVLAAAAVLVAGRILARGAGWFRRAVARGAATLAVGAVVVGIAFALVFDQAFTLFHGLFFASGTWSFDPATDRLVQLFPYDFWTETSVAIAVVGLLLTITTWAFARRSPAQGRA